MSYCYQNERRHQEVERSVLARPSATSLEYEGRSSQQHTASIHNIIEQQSWERRLGISHNFDPNRRGRTFSRANDDSGGVHQDNNPRGGCDQKCGDSSNTNNNNDSNHQRARERSRDRYDDRAAFSGGRNAGKNIGRNDGRNGGYREEDWSVDRRSNAAYTEQSRNHYDNHNLKRDGCNEQHRPRNVQSNNGGEYSRQRDDRGRHSPSRNYSDYPGYFRGHPSSHTWREVPDENSNASGSYLLRGYERGHCNGSRDDRYRENGGGDGQRNGVSQASGNGGGQDHGRNQSSSRQQQTSADDDGWETVPNRADQRNSERKREKEEAPPPEVTCIPANALNGKYQQFMLMLTGVPGSGKSTFAKSLVVGKPWMYVRVNQDALGNRRECENLTRSILKDGKCPIIDRCNFDLSQRKHFLDIAKSFSVPVDCVVFRYDMDLCIRRCQSRRNHETITPQIAVEVVQRMAQQFSPPLPNRNNSETFRTLKTISNVNSFNDLVMEYLTLIT